MDLILPKESIANYLGFVKIWQSNPTTGEQKLLIDKKNTILYTGADILARALAGERNSKVSHFYLAYNNTNNFTPPPITKDNPSYSLFVDPFGYVKVPLSSPAAYAHDVNYEGNVVIFTITITSPEGLQVNTAGAALGDTSNLFEAALVVAGPNVNDKIFSRIQFSPIAYDPTYNLTISWAIKFQS